jgi:hypothetical protein
MTEYYHFPIIVTFECIKNTPIYLSDRSNCCAFTDNVEPWKKVFIGQKCYSMNEFIKREYKPIIYNLISSRELPKQTFIRGVIQGKPQTY